MAATAQLIDEIEGRELVSPPLARLLRLPPEAREQALRGLPVSYVRRLFYDWSFWARPEQLWRPGSEDTTAFLAGRGWGKTVTGAQAVRFVAEHPELCGGRAKRGPSDATYGEGGVIGIAGRTSNDVNQTMIYGPSGIMACSPPWFRPEHRKSDMLLVWPNGVIARLMSGDAEESFRGPNFGFLWADELAHWARASESWENAQLALRHGPRPVALVTTTPIGTEQIRKLLYEMRDDQLVPKERMPNRANDGVYAYRSDVRVVHGSTYDNAANLPRNFIERRVGSIEGTRLPDQELRGRVLFQIPGAIWSLDWIRRCELHEVPGITVVYGASGEPASIEIDRKVLRVVLAIDPTVAEKGENKDGKPVECGLVVVAFHRKNGHAYVLEDGSAQLSTRAWSERAAAMCDRWSCREIAVEDNQGGTLVETNLRLFAPRLPVKITRVHASKDKGERAGLVAPLWHAGKVWHVGNPRGFVRLEHQMTHFDASKSSKGQESDRMDALVWAFLFELNEGSDRSRIQAMGSVEVWARVQQELANRRGRRR